MDNKKNTKIDATRRRKTGGSGCFKKQLFKENRSTKNNCLTNIYSNTTEHQVSSPKKLRKALYIMKIVNDHHIYLLTWIFFHKLLTLLDHVHLVKARIDYLLSTQ